jgi:cysteine desulfurase/selenocysteine lyase
MHQIEAVFPLRSRFSGLDLEVPLLGGGRAAYINFDNAASTPPLAGVRRGVEAFLDYYASVHRGTGFKSQLSTWAYERARLRALAFVGADPDDHTCIFVKNTTEAINKLARRLSLKPDDVVIVTHLEHHSNDLPFRQVANVVHASLRTNGDLDEDDLARKIDMYAGKLRLVAMTGASNVTGYILHAHRFAERAHAAGAMILVDCAQLAPHRPVRMRALDDPSHLDFVALSAHKIYAPYGTGALIGRTDIFERGEPDMTGGGTVEIVTLDQVTWAGPPEREEAGSPNIVGAVAMALAMSELEEIGMATVAAHEAELTAALLERLGRIDKVRVYGNADPASADSRLGVVPFQIEGMSHFLVAAILGYEHGIGVRSGCFCAHPYILALLGLTAQEAEKARQNMLAGDRRAMPGLIRASFGVYNTLDEVERFADAVEMIAAGDYRRVYTQDVATGEYSPDGWAPDFTEYLKLD